MRATNMKQKVYRAIIYFLIFLIFIFLCLQIFTSFSLKKEENDKITVLVFGGAGYIGSHVVLELLRDPKDKYEVVVFDNLSEGYSEPLARVQKLTEKTVKLVKGDINIVKDVVGVFKKYKPDIVFHLCAKISVHESTKDPIKYYQNNIGGTVNILSAMKDFGCKYFVFSSTAAVFGNPVNIPIKSNDPTNPINPYGETKLVVEKLLKSCETAWGLNVASLRYFNAAGADESGRIGEDHRIESHLIPLIIQVVTGKRDKIYVYGNDYDTEDGTCIRDYVHVTDIAQAHIRSLEHLLGGGSSVYVNLGSGTGNSVLDIIKSTERVTGQKVKTEVSGRREGDPPILVASSEMAEKLIGWKRKYTEVDDIIRTAYNWHKNNLNGYRSEAQASKKKRKRNRKGKN